MPLNTVTLTWDFTTVLQAGETAFLQVAPTNPPWTNAAGMTIVDAEPQSVSFTGGPGTLAGIIANDNAGLNPASQGYEITVRKADGTVLYDETVILDFSNGAVQDLSGLTPAGTVGVLTPYLLAASDLSDVASPSAALANLGGISAAAVTAEIEDTALLQAGGTVTGQFTLSANNYFDLDGFTGANDDALMAAAIAAVTAARNGTIQLGARNFAFTLPWATAFVSSSTVTNIQVIGAGSGSAGGVVYPGTGATVCTFNYADGQGSTLACLDMEHVGRLEVAGICFVNTASPNPFIFSSNPTAEIHHCAFNGFGLGRAAAVSDGIIFGGPNFTQGGASGQTAGFFGYGSKAHHNYFHCVRRVVSFGGGCNAVNVEENIIDQTCGDASNWGAPFYFNGGQNSSPGNSANIIRHNYAEMTYYQSFSKTNGSALAVANIIGPNCLQDGALTTQAVWDATCSENWVDDTAQRSDQGYPSYIDYGQGSTSGGTNGGVSTQGGSGRSTVFGKPVTVLADFTVKAEAGGAATEGARGDAAWVTPLHNTNSGITGVQFVGRQPGTVADGAVLSGSHVVTSATAAFISNDIGRYIFATGIPQWSTIVLAAGVTSPGFAWAASTAYAIGSIVVPLNGHMFQATTAGTSGTTVPTWPLTGGTVTDGSVTWTDLGTTVSAAIFSQAATATGTALTVNWGRIGAAQTMLNVMNNHILGTGAAPAYAPQTAQVGTGATATCTGNDISHVVTLTTGAGAQAAGVIVKGTPAFSYAGSSPGGAIMLSAGNAAAAAIIGGLFVTNAGFLVNISSAAALTPSTAYVINVMQVG